MVAIFDTNNEAIRELPDKLVEALKRYHASRSEADLDVVIYSVLLDLGADVDPEAIPDETFRIRDLGLDSLAIAEFVFFFEDVFGLKITNQDLAKMETLNALKSFIRSKLD